MVAPNDRPQSSEIEPETNRTLSTTNRSLPWWRFAVPLLLQTVLVLAVPSQAMYSYLTGKTVILETRPVDPYDILRGYYQTLSYKISDRETLESLPGWDEVTHHTDSSPNAEIFYIIMESPDNPNQTNPPSPWQPVAIRRDRPKSLAPNQVAIQGNYIDRWQIVYGLETYYMPEDRRQQINEQIRDAQLEAEAFVVEIKVDRFGNAVPVSLWVRDANYKF